MQYSTTMPRASVRPKLDVVTEEIEDDIFCSLGAEPVTLRLWTPSHARRQTSEPGSSQESRPSSSTRHPRKPKSSQPKDPGVLKVDVTIGVVAIALRARHIRNIVDLTELWGAHIASKSISKEPQTSQPSRPFLQRVDGNLRLRGVVVTLLPTRTANSTHETMLDYFTHPLVPPRLPHGYVRIHLEELSVTGSMQPTPVTAALRPTSTTHAGNTVSARMAIAELSAFAFIRSPNDANDTELSAIPLLITDPHLPFQYEPTHIHPNLKDANANAQLPTFEVLDWTDPAHRTTSAKLSMWRSKPQHGRGPAVPTSPRTNVRGAYGSPVGLSPLSPSNIRPTAASSPSAKDSQLAGQQSALVIKVTMTSPPPSRRGRSKAKDPENGLEIEVEVTPLHIFTDVTQILREAGYAERSEVLRFIDEVIDSPHTVFEDANFDGASSDEAEDDVDESETPPGTPRARERYSHRQEELTREQERQRLERLVLEDLDLGYDYSRPSRGTGKSVHEGHQKRKVGSWDYS